MRSTGQATVEYDDGRKLELDTFTCAHCNRIVHTGPGRDDGGLCYGCMGMICPTCVKYTGCAPFEAKLEAMHRRHEALRSYGLA